MSVFTPVDAATAAAWLKHYDLGELVELRGIAAGVENTNYFLTTTAGRFVLTLFERLPAASAAAYLELMADLARHGLPCPAPIPARTHALLGELCGRPAALVTRLDGAPVEAPTAAQCAAIGAFLGKMHRVAARLDVALANPRCHDWHAETARAVSAHLNAADAALLGDEIARQAKRKVALPRGITHADLFRDNALFAADGHLTGVIDFYFAAENNLLFDVAITANDWCLAADGISLDPNLTAALLRGYHAERPLQDAECAAWRDELCAAALRFWLSRLHDHHQPRDGDMVGIKDPEPFRRILAARAAGSLPWMWRTPHSAQP